MAQVMAMSDKRRDLERLQAMTRVRDLRARIASRAALRRRQGEASAEVALEDAHRRRLEHEEQAARAFAWSSGEQAVRAGFAFRAGDAHRVLSYVAGARVRLLEDVPAIRRAELARDHARSRADEARAEYRRELSRQQRLASQRERRRQALQQQEREREDESLVEERNHIRAGSTFPWPRT
jgi:hypothetical protein